MAPLDADAIVASWFRPTRGKEGVAAAERWARELFARLLPWTASSTPTIEWKSVDKPPRHAGTFGGAFELASDAVLEALEQQGVTREALAPADARLPYVVDRVVRLHRAWQIAVERDLEVLPATWPPSAVRDRRFAALPDPFQPILEIWSLGYLIDADDDRALLMAPIATLV